jgi:hypothetical protein
MHPDKMPICNMCGEGFDVEKEPGALIFGHPSTVKEAVSVWKAHICQGCETKIIDMFQLKPKGNKPQELDSSLPADMGGNAEKAKGKLELKMDDWETLLAFLDQLPEFSKDIKRIHGELEEQFNDMEEVK